MAKNKLDINVLKLIKVMMRSFSKEQITQTLNYIQDEISTEQQRKENVVEWQSLLKNIKQYRNEKAEARITRKKEYEF